MATPPRLLASVVVYQPDPGRLQATLTSLAAAATAAHAASVLSATDLRLVDNGPEPEGRERLERMVAQCWSGAGCGAAEVVAADGNIGYGRGNNLGFEGGTAEYLLALNPDVEMEPDALVEGIGFLRDHREVGMLTPFARDGAGARQYLCKRYPSVMDLFLRGFVPRALHRPFARRLARYEMRGVTGERPVDGIRIAGGCFLLLRREVFAAVGGFSSDYFLYFEDFDLSLRVAREAGIAYVPSVRIVHHGGSTARKGGRHILYFVQSAWRFFRRHGWRWR